MRLPRLLDSKSEKKIQDSLSNLISNKTALIIAHRLSTVIDADRIIIINNGEIVDIGKHSSLIKKSKIYKNLYDLQFKKQNDKKILKHNNFQLFLGWLISFYIRICFNTSTWIIKNVDVVTNIVNKKQSVIVCFWHSRLLMAPFCWNWEKRIQNVNFKSS